MTLKRSPIRYDESTSPPVALENPVPPLQFPLFSALVLSTGLFAMAVALLLLVFFRLARWKQHRYFFIIVLAAGVFGVADFGGAGPFSPMIKLLCARVQLFAAGVHISGWVAYAGADLGGLPKDRQRVLEWLPGSLGLLLLLVPSLSVTGQFVVLPFRIFGANYVHSELTSFAVACAVVMIFVLVLMLLRYLAAALRGRAQSRSHVLALSVFVVCGGVDLLTVAQVWRLPLVTPFGVALGVIPITMVLAARWRQDVEQHEQMSSTLERQVEIRTSELTAALATLGRTEKLAAVGRLAGGMAHEINNPGAALIANLEYLQLGLQRGEQLPADVGETVHESLEAARRISKTVRQLLLLSRAAIAESEGHSFDLKLVAGQALRAARDAEGARGERHVSTVVFEERIPVGLRSSGRGQLLEQALRSLLAQLAASAPSARTSRIQLGAATVGARVRLEVRADFRGLDSGVREQLTQPFLAPQSPEGGGASFGLAASLGLLRTLGAEVVLEEQTAGTNIVLLLDSAPPEVLAPIAQA